MNFDKKLWEQFINDSRQYHLDSFTMKAELQPDIWDGEAIEDDISDRLVEIVNDFMEFCGFTSKDYRDITLTGSLANYNWSQFSDVDLHIIVDLASVDENKELVQEFFNAKRSLWNRTHDIDIHGFEVEVYVQDEGEPHVSTGVYSVLNDTWITKPEPSDPKIDFEGVKSKASMIMDEIDRVWDLFEDKKYEESLNYIEKLKEKIKNMRKTGLEREGQYSNENLAFKILRRNGSMGELLDLRTTVYDKMMSIDKNFVSKLKIFVDASENDNKKGFDSLQEIEKFQKRVQSKHKRLKSKLIGKGNQNPGCGGSPYTNKPNKGRAKSAPPGAGGV
jgi:hypothetical protein